MPICGRALSGALSGSPPLERDLRSVVRDVQMWNLGGDEDLYTFFDFRLLLTRDSPSSREWGAVTGSNGQTNKIFR
uniref:Uncharacterized protein n=1 Tax=Steinernema glaseri TaxID=37863 RepID=A0A1I8A6P4_9BILA